MLAGLLFATHEAEDRGGTLAATLPFAGLTLIEYQARLLIASGATQIVLVVGRVTPELLGAIARIGRRGIAIDQVRNAAELAARLHPLARVLMLADSLVAGERAVAAVAAAAPDAIAVVPAGTGAVAERIDSETAWAGLAHLDPARIADLAAMPGDYDVQSSLLRIAVQRRATRIAMSPDDARAGHGVERRAAALEGRGRGLMAAMLAEAPSWFDRWVVAPLARPAMAEVLARHWPTMAVAGAAGGLGLTGLAALALGQGLTGLAISTMAAIVAAAGAPLARLRDEAGLARAVEALLLALPALAVLLFGLAADRPTGDWLATVAALALVVAGALAERAATPGRRRLWWGTPPAYLLVATLASPLVGAAAGIAAAAAYATVTLAAAVEALRKAVGARDL